jgi:hypothetical protein
MRKLRSMGSHHESALGAIEQRLRHVWPVSGIVQNLQ